MSELTVIMPAAGKGTRLNLPYPKEILRLDKEQALIDFSFDFFRDYGRKDVEFVIVINEEKTEIVKYLSKYKDRFNITFTYQNPYEKEYTGAIKSARHLFGDNNVVLLPDTVMTVSPNMDLGQTVLRSLKSTGFTFFYKEEDRPEMLKTKGALKVNPNFEVIAYEDKPQEHQEEYNGYWCSFAFTKIEFDRAINFMEKSTLKQDNTINFQTTPLYKCKAIPVEDYKDLGTWPEVRKWLRDAE